MYKVVNKVGSTLGWALLGKIFNNKGSQRYGQALINVLEQTNYIEHGGDVPDIYESDDAEVVKEWYGKYMIDYGEQ